VDFSKANAVQTPKSSKESTSECKALTLWWMGDALDTRMYRMMHTYILFYTGNEMTRNQDASRDEKEKENEINLNSNRTLSVSLYTLLSWILPIHTPFYTFVDHFGIVNSLSYLYTSRLEDPPIHRI